MAVVKVIKFGRGSSISKIIMLLTPVLNPLDKVFSTGVVSFQCSSVNVEFRHNESSKPCWK